MWGKAMKRLILAVLVICLLFTGCGVIHDTKGAGDDVPTTELDLSSLDAEGSTKKAAIYFLNSANGTLTADPRFITVEQNTNPAEAAIKALLGGPINESLKSVAPEGMRLDFIEYSNGVGNIYLKYDGTPMEQSDKYTMELAIANTVSDLLGATAVNIFYNGLREGFQGYPSAPLKKQTATVEEAFNGAKAKYLPSELTENQNNAIPTQTPEADSEATEDVPKTNTISTVLYFVSASGDYILPEVRDITYATTGTGIDKIAISSAYVETIINELKVDPLNTVTMESPIESDAFLIREPELIENADGTLNVALAFDKPPTGIASAVSKKLAYAAMVYTITGFIPNIKAVYIYVDNALVYQLNDNTDATHRSDFIGYIGSSAPLFLQYADSGLLIEVSRSMEQGKTWSALERVRAIVRGPQEGDIGNVNPVIYSDMTEDGVLSVDVYGDTAFVNLSADFKKACEELSPKDEMLLVYAIVNTATAMDGVNKVQFLVEGAQTDTLAGHLCISDPFLRNFGIIKNGS